MRDALEDSLKAERQRVAQLEEEVKRLRSSLSQAKVSEEKAMRAAKSAVDERDKLLLLRSSKPSTLTPKDDDKERRIMALQRSLQQAEEKCVSVEVTHKRSWHSFILVFVFAFHFSSCVLLDFVCFFFLFQNRISLLEAASLRIEEESKPISADTDHQKEIETLRQSLETSEVCCSAFRTVCPFVVSLLSRPPFVSLFFSLFLSCNFSLAQTDFSLVFTLLLLVFAVASSSSFSCRALSHRVRLFFCVVIVSFSIFLAAWRFCYCRCGASLTHLAGGSASTPDKQQQLAEACKRSRRASSSSRERSLRSGGGGSQQATANRRNATKNEQTTARWSKQVEKLSVWVDFSGRYVVVFVSSENAMTIFIRFLFSANYPVFYYFYCLFRISVFNCELQSRKAS